jgi:hypothetical protein
MNMLVGLMERRDAVGCGHQAGNQTAVATAAAG